MHPHQPPSAPAVPLERLFPDTSPVRHTLERLAAAVVTAAAAPVLGAIAAAVKLTSPGPAFYRCQRLGRGGIPFTCYKFRTMRVDAPKIVSEDDKTVVENDDPRLTPIGKFLRKGFDELPQLLNVVRGEMSFVGPRPDEVWMLPRYTERLRTRLAVRPGMTGLATVLDSRSLTTPEGYALDIWYVENRSWWLDALILAATPLYALGWTDVAKPFQQRLLARLQTEGLLLPRSTDPRPSTP